MKKDNVSESNLLVIIVVLTVILSILGRLLSFGWITEMFILVPIIPIYVILFVVAAISLARVNKKNTKDYVMFSFLCLTMIVSSFAFIDYNDSGFYNMLFTNVNEEVFEYISIVSFILNVSFSIYTIISTGKRKYVYEK